MPEASSPQSARWSVPRGSISILADPASTALEGWLTPPDRAAGVAHELVTLAIRHGSVRDSRAISVDGALPQLHAVWLQRDPTAWTLTVHPDPGRAGVLAALAAEGGAVVALHRFLRHDVRVPVELARQALSSHPAAADPEGLEATALATLERVAGQADRAGQTRSPVQAHQWVDLSLLVDVVLARDGARLSDRGLTVTRGVMPVIWADPTARLHALTRRLHDATLGVPRGTHLHLVAREQDADLAVVAQTVRAP